jgi:exopolysaccharide production protein ExoQ
MTHPISDRTAAIFLIAASFFLGVALPAFMGPATKSSPLMLGLAALCALLAFGCQHGLAAMYDRARAFCAGRAAVLSGLALLYMAVSVAWAHNPASSLSQLVQFVLPIFFSILLVMFFAPSAPSNRSLPWILAATATAVVVLYDLKTGMKLRELTGGRHFSYSYNRTIVTLVVLLWPLLALAASRKQWYLGLFLLPVFLVAAAGDSETAVLGAAIGIVVLPLAWRAPVLVRKAGIVLTLVLIAVSPFIGTLAKWAMGATLHKALANAHSDDRVNIWLSFEAVVQQNWIFGSGFGSSLNLQNGAVAKLIPPELVTLLGASHPHNAILQVWVELGLVGALLLAAFAVMLFAAVGRMAPLLQPFALACVAVVCGIALVSHGAWQAWWMAAVGAAIVSFTAMDQALRRTT